MLLGAVAKVLGDEGIELISSTSYLEPLLAKEGVLTARPPNERELLDIEYGRRIAAIIAAHDIGQTVVVAGQACVAVEAMEGTDATILRAGAIMKSLEDEASTSGTQPDRGESRQTEAGPPLRCAGDRRSHHRGHAPGQRHLPLARRRADADF